MPVVTTRRGIPSEGSDLASVLVLSAELMKEELIRRLSVRGVQAKVARDLSLSATTVNKWAMGYNLPEPERWAALEQSLGMEPGTLAALSTPPGSPDLLAELRNELRRMGVELQHLRDEVAELRGERQRSDSASPRSRRAAVGGRK